MTAHSFPARIVWTAAIAAALGGCVPIVTGPIEVAGNAAFGALGWEEKVWELQCFDAAGQMIARESAGRLTPSRRRDTDNMYRYEWGEPFSDGRRILYYNTAAVVVPPDARCEAVQVPARKEDQLCLFLGADDVAPGECF